MRAARSASYTHRRTRGNRGARMIARAVPQLPPPMMARFFTVYVAQALVPAVARLPVCGPVPGVSTLLCGCEPSVKKSAGTSADAAGKSACATELFGDMRSRSKTKDVLLPGAQSLDITTMFVDNKRASNHRGDYGRQRRVHNQPYGQWQGGRHDDRAHGYVSRPRYHHHKHHQHRHKCYWCKT